MEINLNLDTYYDCRGIYNSELNPECRNTIVDNYSYDKIRLNNYIFNTNF